jgi:undecaprenyl-diphosphatase
MHLIQAIILGIVQGLTEFIPVSSSGHLIIAEHFLGITSGGLAFDVALHAGTLLALILIFGKDFWRYGKAALSGHGSEAKMGRLLILATVPAVLSGLLLEELVATSFRSVFMVSVNLIWVGIIMLAVERWASRNGTLEQISLKQAAIVGTAQALAIVPGISRSGSTIAAGRMAGLDRVAAARFSFLLSGPIIAGALLKQILGGGQLTGQYDIVMAGVLAAFVSGYIAIKFLLGYLSRYGLGIFAWYRIGLGVILLMVGL